MERVSLARYLALEAAHAIFFPHRQIAFRHPWQRAEDLMNHNQFSVSKLGKLSALRVLCIVLFDVAFPNEESGRRCKAKARLKINEILAIPGKELWWDADFYTVETLLNQAKSLKAIRTVLTHD